jgi:hypothetical protein
MVSHAYKVQRLTLEYLKPRKEHTILLHQKMFALVRKVALAEFVRFEVLVMNILEYEPVQYGR